MLIGAEQEQPVLDHRTAEIGAPTLVRLDRRDIEGFAVGNNPVAAQAIVRIFEEAAEVVIVGARFGNDIDRAAGELAVIDIEPRELDLRFAYRVKRDRGDRKSLSL